MVDVDRIPLFDAMTHPTVDGGWIGDQSDASFDKLIKEMKEAGVARGCAVGLRGVGSYDHQTFLTECLKFPQLIPIAGFCPRTSVNIATELEYIRDLGFAGIKIHPRLSNFRLKDACFLETLANACRLDIPVFLCTYQHAVIDHYPDSDPLFDLVAALKQSPKVRLVLCHGGDVDIMRYMQLARHSESILLDVSFTLMKYAGSSIDIDLKYIFKGFNRRTCFGTDFPEFKLADCRRRLEDLTGHLDYDEAFNISYRNIRKFLRLEE